MLNKHAHFFHLNNSESLPQRYIKCLASFTECHPDWLIDIHSAADAPAILEHRLLERLRPHLTNFYNTLAGCYRPLPVQSDLLKMLYVYCYGGVALDSDLYFIRNINDLLDTDLLLCNVTDEPRLVSEAVIGANPQSIHILNMVKRWLTAKPNSEGIVSANLSPMARDRGWYTYPRDYFIPHNKYEVTEAQKYSITENTRAIHLWGSHDYEIKKLKAIKKRLSI